MNNPSRKQAQSRLLSLREDIKFHERKYYVDNQPQITDYVFDQLIKELQNLERLYPDLITPDSPTQRVGEQSLDGFLSVPHSQPMLSLDNCYSEEEFAEFEERINRLIPDESPVFVAELKIDGLGISIRYRNGHILQAVTRGDGLHGDEVTQNIKTIRSVPLSIRQSSDVEVRGEVYLPFRSFRKINADREEKGESPFANPRNAAAGSIRMLDPKTVASRELDIFLYSLYFDGQELESQTRTLATLKELGFKTNPFSRLCRSRKEVITFWKEWTEKRDSLDYDIDGIVVKVDSHEMQGRLGSTSKFPRWAVSLKFPARQATTIVEDIRIQVGRTGALTPVAFLKPVKLSGTIISRATLHNEEEIRRKDIRIGDTILLERSGDVIPKVVSVIKEKRSGQEPVFSFPLECPACLTRAFRPEGEVVARCPNPSCPAKLKESLLHFASRKAMDIEGLGDALVDLLLEKNYVSSIPDIFTLKHDQLAGLERMGEKSASNLLEQILKAKSRDLSKLIFGLGIRYVGERTAKILSGFFRHMDTLASASVDDLIEIPDIGPKAAESVVFFFGQKSNLDLIESLRKAGLNFQAASPPSDPLEGSSLPFKGLTFVITGTLETMTREQAKEEIEEKGGILSSSISGKTTYLVAGQSPGSKLGKAKQLNITILSEEDFLSILARADLS